MVMTWAVLTSQQDGVTLKENGVRFTSRRNTGQGKNRE